MEKRLNPKQKRFVQEYLRIGNATEAAVSAGYSPKSAASWGSRLLDLPEVQAYRRELEQEMFDEMGVSRAWIGRRLVEITERCMQKTPVLEWNSETRQKEFCGVWQFDPSGALKALHELAAQMGFAEGGEAEQAVKLIVLGDGTDGIDE